MYHPQNQHYYHHDHHQQYHHYQHRVLLVTLLLVLYAAISEAFPRDYSIHPFYGNSPHMLEMDFPVNSKFYSALADHQAPMLGGPAHMASPGAGIRHSPATPPHLVSQNRKYFTKTPAHDQHFAKILAQQEQATIRSPIQAMKVASDHAATQSKLRNSLQTSDDDVYEVESAPVMKAAPYQSYRGPYDRDMMDIPVRLEIESSMDEPNYPRYGQRGAQKRQSHEEAESAVQPGYSAPQPPEQTTDLHFTLGLERQDEDEGRGKNYEPRRMKPTARPYRAAASQRKPHYASSTYRPPARVVAHHHHQQPSAAWLDMGAYSSGMGAFGWYSDVPVGSRY